MPSLFGKENKPTIIIATQDWSGLGWAKLSIDAGFTTILAYKMKDDEDHEDEYNQVGEGIADKIELGVLFKARNKYKNAYWIWDQNHNWEMADQLRKEGFKVWGGQEISYKSEKDRNFGTELAKGAGLTPPDTQEFSDAQSGLEFLQQNSDKGFVFKPDESEGAYTTFVPDSDKDDEANEELQRYLMSQDGETGTYILQERKKGTETNIELWLYKGKPFLAYCNLECKRKLDFDEGEMVGSSQSIGFIVPLNCRLVKETVAKLLPTFKDYTGAIDCNIIVADRQFYWLEFCNRMGYDAHANLFLNLALKSFPEIMIDWMDGNVKNFEENFRFGFGATITCYIDHPHKGYPLIIPEDVENKFFHFDSYKDENGYCLAGYGNEVGYIAAHDFDIKSAGMMAIKNADKISYPMHAIRHDLDGEQYISSPFKRYIALQAMKMFDVEN